MTIFDLQDKYEELLKLDDKGKTQFFLIEPEAIDTLLAQFKKHYETQDENQTLLVEYDISGSQKVRNPDFKPEEGFFPLEHHFEAILRAMTKELFELLMSDEKYLETVKPEFFEDLAWLGREYADLRTLKRRMSDSLKDKLDDHIADSFEYPNGYEDLPNRYLYDIRILFKEGLVKKIGIAQVCIFVSIDKESSEDPFWKLRSLIAHLPHIRDFYTFKFFLPYIVSKDKKFMAAIELYNPVNLMTSLGGGSETIQEQTEAVKEAFERLAGSVSEQEQLQNLFIVDKDLRESINSETYLKEMAQLTRTRYQLLKLVNKIAEKTDQYKFIPIEAYRQALTESAENQIDNKLGELEPELKTNDVKTLRNVLRNLFHKKKKFLPELIDQQLPDIIKDNDERDALLEEFEKLQRGNNLFYDTHFTLEDLYYALNRSGEYKDVYDFIKLCKQKPGFISIHFRIEDPVLLRCLRYVGRE